MDRLLLALSIISALMILAQWFVFQRIRTYIFDHYDPIKRSTAYFVLALIGILNIVAARFALGNELFGPNTFEKKVLEVAFFTYLGGVLLLCMFFLILGLVSSILSAKDALFKMLRTSTGESEPSDLTGDRSAWSASEKDHLETTLCHSGIPGCKAESVTSSQPGSAPTSADETIATATSPLSPDRRMFLKWGAVTALAVTAGSAGDGIVRAYSSPVVEEFDVAHPQLQGLARPSAVIQITDFHFGMFTGTSELERLVTRTNKLEADAVFVTGDIFHSPLSPVELAVPILKELKPRRFGNFAILGNHDFYAGEWRSVKCIKESGLRLLRDEWITLEAGAAKIHLGGIDDPMANWVWGKEFPDFPSFMDKAPREPGMRILLSHRPNVLPLASQSGIDFVLSGHIHGGQIILPVPGTDRGVSIAGLVSNFTHGWYSMGDCRMYLNRGTGLTFVPWRINCPPEIAIFHLKPSESQRWSVRRVRPVAV